MFSLTALAAALGVRAGTTQKSLPTLLTCDRLTPRSPHGLVCFESVSRLPKDQPNIANLVHSDGAERIGQLWSKSVASILRLPSRFELNRSVRTVTLLTRRSGPHWSNRDEVASLIGEIVKQHAGFSFFDAGNAEDLGYVQDAHGSPCWAARKQVELWRKSWLVVTPHGAHESNVLNMVPGSGGLLESFNCMHDSGTYSRLARAAGVGYSASHEKSSPARHHCENLGTKHRAYLDVPRHINFRYDDMLEVLERVLSQHNAHPREHRVLRGGIVVV